MNDTTPLPDGRTLAWREFGPPNGPAILCFHGWPGSSRHFVPFADVATALGVRVIAPDRPGIGDSSRQPGRRLRDWPNDVVAMADSIGIERFAVLGYSFGAPFALACANALPERVSAVGLVGGVGRVDRRTGDGGIPRPLRIGLRCALHAPGATAFILGRALRAAGEAAPFVARVVPHLAEDDGRLLTERPDVTDAVGGAAEEMSRSGGRGAMDDLRAVAQSWGFQPGSIRCPMFLWHGVDDELVSVEVSERLAAEVPGAALTAWPGRGHFAIYDHAEGIVRRLTRG